MAVVRLHGPLAKLAGGRADHPLEGGTVAELLRGLEGAQPALRGWILDERGRVRRHLHVYVNGEHGAVDMPVAASDRIDVVQAISGG
jgi:molybdopterin synthase sulfur carrier subunit